MVAPIEGQALSVQDSPRGAGDPQRARHGTAWHGTAGSCGAEGSVQHSSVLLPGLGGRRGSSQLLHKQFAAVYRGQMRAFMSY